MSSSEDSLAQYFSDYVEKSPERKKERMAKKESKPVHVPVIENNFAVDSRN
jgi:hypothetical protein